MFSFRSIFIAAAAFATLTSAIPVADPATSLGEVTNVLSRDLSVKRGGGGPTYRTPGDITKTCHDNIVPIVANIKAIVAIEGFDHGEVTDCFNQIAVQLNIAIADLKVTVAAGVTLDLLLILNGVVCSLGDLAGVVYGLLFLVIEVLVIVLKLVINVDVPLCNLLYSVSGLLVQIVGLVLGLVAGLDVVLVVLVRAISGDIIYLGCTPILTLLGIQL